VAKSSYLIDVEEASENKSRRDCFAVDIVRRNRAVSSVVERLVYSSFQAFFAIFSHASWINARSLYARRNGPTNGLSHVISNCRKCGRHYHMEYHIAAQPAPLIVAFVGTYKQLYFASRRGQDESAVKSAQRLQSSTSLSSRQVNRE
jgi:hypothetical protein